MEPSSVGPGHHTVAFHATGDDLLQRLTESVADGLAAGESVVVIASPDHCARVGANLCDDLTLDDFVARGRYRDVDAVALLEAIRDEHGLDGDAFERLVGALVATAGAGGRQVRVVGDLVGIMWDEGDAVGALELEALWNDLVRRTGVLLTCAYPADGRSDDLDSLCGVCACHTAVDLSAELPGTEDVGDGAVSRLFVPHRGAAIQARRHVERTLRDWQCDEVIPDAMLLTSEIATNAVIHARSPFRLTVARSAGAVRIAVTDGASAMPVRRHPAPDEPGGRGLALVEMLTIACGADRVGAGKVVWAELAV